MLPRQHPPADESVKIPAALRAAAAKAEGFYKKADPPAPPEEAKAPVDPPAELKPEGLTVAPQTPPAEPVRDAPKAESPPPEPFKEQNWEHAYKSMKGRYDRAESTISQLRDRVADMESVIAGLGQASPQPRAKKTEPAERLVTDKERDEYGNELIDLMGRRAKEELNPLVQDHRSASIDTAVHITVYTLRYYMVEGTASR